MKFELGTVAQDKITGFTGIITGHSNYLTGCDQYLLQPKAKKKYECPESYWFDEGRLANVKAKGVAKEDVTNDDDPPGADKPAPKK